MDSIRGDEVRHGQSIYLDALSQDRIASIPDESLSEAMLNNLHDNTSAIQPMTSHDAVEKIKAQGGMVFAICLREDQTCIGVASLNNEVWSARHAQLTIGIVHEALYTVDMLADAIQTLLQFAYWEANLNRIYVHCASDNHVLQAALDRRQFTREGCLRQDIYRNGKYLDLCIYSMLQCEWRG